MIRGDLYRGLLLFISLHLLSATAFAADKAVNASRLDQQPVSLTEYLAVLEDPHAALTLSEVQQPEVASRFVVGLAAAEALAFGFSRSAYWLRLTLLNPDDHPIERLLELDYARFSTIEFHQPRIGGGYDSIQTGITRPFATRPYQNRNFVFPISLPAHSNAVFFLRLKSHHPLVIPAKLWTPPAFQAKALSDYISQSWYFGAAISMMLFNMLLFFSLRDRIYLLYVLFVACSVLVFAVQNGLAHEFLWPDAPPQWSDLSIYIGFTLTIVSLISFTRSMLDTTKTIPRLDRLLKILIAFHLLIPIPFVIALPSFAQSLVVLTLLSATLTLVVGLYCVVKRQRSAYFFVTAFSLVLCGSVIYFMKNQGWLPTNMFTTNVMQMGSALEMILLALALADRFAQMRKETVQAQQLLVDGLRTSEHLLEERVAQRTEELEVANQKLATLSATDGLTGIANRRRFDERSSEEWARAQRNGQPLALLLLDVDQFKAYNDYYGHQAGDGALQQVARVLQEQSRRPSDLAARYGGEEFAVIAADTSSDTALRLAERIRAGIEALALPHCATARGVITVSMGVAVTDTAAPTDLKMLLAQADAALYSAKESGRNRVIVAPPANASPHP